MRRSLVFLALVCGCADDTGIADGGVPCLTGSCANPTPDEFACQNVVDASGRPASANFLVDLTDPVAVGMLKRPGPCPATYSGLIAKFRLEDRARCRGDSRAGMLGRVVSERAQLLAQADQVRVVVSRQCSSRPPYSVFFSLPPIDADNPELPETPVHVIAFDDFVDAYSFYTLDETATWTFHGNSLDIVDGDPATGAGCADCHTDGGLVMREIHEPWVHWESGATRTAGAQVLIDRFEDLGSRGTAPELAQTIRDGNSRWRESRIARWGDELNVDAHGGSLQALLAPLFCATSYNLGSAGRPNAAGAPMPVTDFPAAFFVDPAWQRGTRVPIDTATYQTALAETGSRIEDIAGPRDTFFGFTFVTRAAADVDYVDLLIARGLIDEEFALDVLSVDFTRPVFSDQRCALLDFVPDFADLDDTSTPPPPATGGQAGCCEPHGFAGCDDADIEQCVCDEDEFCCEDEWDHSCVNRARESCDACEGVAVAPGLAAPPRAVGAPVSANALRNAMYAKLAAASPAEGSPAAQLRDALATRDQVDAHRADVDRFLHACRDRARVRDEAALILDVLHVAARRRSDAREHAALLDAAGAVVTDDLLPAASAHLDPVTCALAE